MGVFRVHKTKDYTVMANTHLRDKSLSLKAKGLLTIMLSLPDDWDYSILGLTALSKDGKDAIMSTLSELREHGYVRMSQGTNNSGQFTSWDYDVFEVPDAKYPDSEQPHSEQPHSENPNTENPTQYNTNIRSSKVKNTKEYEESLSKDKSSSSKKVVKESPQLDYSFIEDEWKDAFREWVMYKIERKEMYKTQRTIMAAYRQLKECALQNPSNAISVVTQSIGNNYKGLFPIKNYGQSSSANINGHADGYGSNNASATYRAISEECGRVLTELFRQD